jgi:hypothetical protein
MFLTSNFLVISFPKHGGGCNVMIVASYFGDRDSSRRICRKQDHDSELNKVVVGVSTELEHENLQELLHSISSRLL